MTENPNPPVPQMAAQAVEGRLATAALDSEGGLVFRRPEAAVNVAEMTEGIRQAIAPHMEQFIGQQNTQEVQGRMQEVLNDWADAAGIRNQRVAGTFAEALRNNDIQAADTAIREGTDGRLGVSVADNTRYTNSLDQLKKYSKIQSKPSQEDERLALAFNKGRKAFEDMDYIKSHEALGEFLEITSGSRGAEFRTDEGRLPNYVPIQTVREMVGHFMSSMEVLIKLRDSLKEFEKFYTKKAKRGEALPSSELYYHVDSRVCEMIENLRWACERELGHISKEGVPSSNEDVEGGISVDEFEDIDDSPEELTEAQRLILEIDRIAVLQREQEQMGWQVRTGRFDELTTAVAPPLQGVAAGQALNANAVWVDAEATQGEGPTESEF